MKAATKGYMGQLWLCTKRRLRAGPTSWGMVEISWTVDGRVSEAPVEGNETGDDELAGCLTKMARRWTFEGDGEMSWPFIFVPS